MPVYEYQCQECGREFEFFARSISRQAEVVCPKCGSAQVRKGVSLFGFGRAGGTGEASAASCGPAST